MKEALDHFGDRLFLSRAVTNNGLLHFAGGNFINFQAGFPRREEAGAAGLAHEDGSLEVLRKENAFHDANARVKFANHLAERCGDFDQTARMLPPGRTNDSAVGEGLGEGFGELDDAETGAPQRRIDTENDLVGDGRGQPRALQQRGRGAEAAVEALLDLLKLPCRDAHFEIVPEAARS